MATKQKIKKGGMKFKKNLLRLEVGITGHIFGREPSNDYFIKMLFLLIKWFQTRRFLPISTKLC
jgi:hypothetical protein